MRLAVAFAAILLASPVLAEEAKPAPPPDDSTPITLTYGELKALISANIAAAQFQQAQNAAKDATEKLRAQLAPKKSDAEKKP